VINGQVAGLWKRTFQKNKVIIETDFFQPADKSTKSHIDSKVHLYGKFLNKEAEVRMNG
jgi:type II secretory pathway component PulJ